MEVRHHRDGDASVILFVHLDPLLSPGGCPLEKSITRALLLASFQLGLATVKHWQEIRDQLGEVLGISSPLPPCIGIMPLAVFASFQDYTLPKRLFAHNLSSFWVLVPLFPSLVLSHLE